MLYTGNYYTGFPFSIKAVYTKCMEDEKLRSISSMILSISCDVNNLNHLNTLYFKKQVNLVYLNNGV